MLWILAFFFFSYGTLHAYFFLKARLAFRVPRGALLALAGFLMLMIFSIILNKIKPEKVKESLSPRFISARNGRGPFTSFLEKRDGLLYEATFIWVGYRSGQTEQTVNLPA